MYYGFVDDTAFKTQGTITYSDAVYPACVMDRQLGNYFHENLKVKDTREARLWFKDYILNSNKLSFHFDGSKHTTPFFGTITNTQLKYFFNVLEKIMYSDGTVTSELEETLTTSTDYTGYVPESVRRSFKTTSVTIPKENLKWSDAYKNDPIEDVSIVIPEYIQFELKYASDLNEVIRIYLVRQAFLDDYPLSTITSIILPCDHKYLLDPSQSSGVIDMLIKSNEYSFLEMNSEVEAIDHSGLMTYYTKFVTSKPSATNLLPFGVLYQGHVPTSLEIRKAIRNKLLNYGTATQDTWEAILPDLFVEAMFYIVPLWDNSIVRANIANYYPSIINFYKILNRVKALFPNTDEAFISDNQELFVCGQSEVFLTSLPDELNNNIFSIAKLHPTYQYHMSQDGSAFLNQEVATRDFNTRLNRCMSVAFGETTLADIVNNTIDDKLWYSFVSGNVEYHVLSKESYDTFFENE